MMSAVERVALLAGGTGAAKLAVGLEKELGPGALTVISNSADDVDFWGLRVCPDTDACLFRLAGIFNEKACFGGCSSRASTRRVLHPRPWRRCETPTSS